MSVLSPAASPRAGFGWPSVITAALAVLTALVSLIVWASGVDARTTRLEHEVQPGAIARLEERSIATKESLDRIEARLSELARP